MKAALQALKTRAFAFFAAIEAKVKAQVTAGTVTAVAVWLLGHYVYRDGIPESVRTLIDVAAPVVAGAVAGWLAKHTTRTPVVTGPKALADPAKPGD